MATYEYKCENDHVQAEVRSIDDRDLETQCEVCSLEMRRIYSAPPIIFNGKGFNARRG